MLELRAKREILHARVRKSISNPSLPSFQNSKPGESLTETSGVKAEPEDYEKLGKFLNSFGWPVSNSL